MASRKIEDLTIEMQQKAHLFLFLCKQAGIDVLIYCTYRSNEEQRALYAQGRRPLQEVNALREKVSLPAITAKQNKIVTYAKEGQSKHNIRCAFDCVPLVAGKAIWDKTNPIWQDIGKIGESVGLKWAGNWKRFKEYPHFEIGG